MKEPGRANPAHRSFVRRCPVPLLLMLIGCNSLHPSRDPDPLLGGPALRGTATPSKAQADAPTAPVATLPPLPAPPLGNSNAALASGIGRPILNNADMRIASTPTAGADGWTGQDRSTQGTGNGAVLRQPEVGVQPVAQQTPAPNSPATPPPRGSGIANYEQAQGQLAARGVIWQRLETSGDNGEWRFSCSLPNPNNPRLRRTYEGRARDFLSAIQAVLDQIDRDK
jgi:hypothetical protein